MVVPNLALGTDYERPSSNSNRYYNRSWISQAPANGFFGIIRLWLSPSPRILPGTSQSTTRWMSWPLFLLAPPQLRALEDELLVKADVVFAGGASLYETTRERRDDVHLFPSSVDMVHFSRARELRQSIGNPESSSLTVGFFGVIDERWTSVCWSRLRDCVRIGTLTLLGP